ncbi:hypothetical protein AB0O76_26750 [Streptomyces sp. NPDC086554]
MLNTVGEVGFGEVDAAFVMLAAPDDHVKVLVRPEVLSLSGV